MEDWETLKKEYTRGLWWLAWCKCWGNIGALATARAAMDAATERYNALKREYGVKGRPKGAKNKPKTNPEPALDDILDSM